MTREEMITAMLEKNAAYNGKFYAAVKTTGIVCLPSCSAKPLPKNVEFYDSLKSAIDAGYRPCKRGKPENFKGETNI